MAVFGLPRSTSFLWIISNVVGLTYGGAALVDEHGAARAAAERLDAELARAGKEVEHAPALDVELDEVEHGFLDVIGRGTGGHSLRLAQPAAAGRTCDHTHGGSPFG